MRKEISTEMLLCKHKTLGTELAYFYVADHTSILLYTSILLHSNSTLQLHVSHITAHLACATKDGTTVNLV